jgi:cell division protein ZapA
MASVTLTIGGRNHVVNCRDGGEDELKALGRRLDSFAAPAQRASGSTGERMLLFIALMLADELVAAEGASAAKAPSPQLPLDPSPPMNAEALGRIAERLESIARALEGSTASS